MSAYVSLAQVYDSLMPAQAYQAWAESCDALFRPRGLHTVLDLACGTGRLSWLLAEKGYEVIGADLSSEMLAEAMNGGGDREVPVRPMFICQAMEALDLYGTVQAAVCSMDSLNYLEPEALREAVRRVRLFLEPGGVFLFDVHAPARFREMDGRTFSSESKDAFCVWTAALSEDGRVCEYDMDVFTRAGKLWQRSGETHREYVHEPEKLRRMLEDAGFRSVRICGGLPLREPAPEDRRLFFLAEA